MDNFGRKPQDLCTYSSPLFKILRKVSLNRINKEVKKVDQLEDKNDFSYEGLISTRDIVRTHKHKEYFASNMVT